MDMRGREQPGGREHAGRHRPDMADDDSRIDASEAGGSGSRPGRGHLRIYLGSAAGVGKSYAMLSEAHRRAERRADVVVAFAEAQGRPWRTRSCGPPTRSRWST